MANLIELAKSYVPMLDEVYKLASCTSDLDGAPELARQGANANELIVPMLEMDGLADYDRERRIRGWRRQDRHHGAVLPRYDDYDRRRSPAL